VSQHCPLLLGADSVADGLYLHFLGHLQGDGEPCASRVGAAHSRYERVIDPDLGKGDLGVLLDCHVAAPEFVDREAVLMITENWPTGAAAEFLDGLSSEPEILPVLDWAAGTQW
jgi:hypothetical protein